MEADAQAYEFKERRRMFGNIAFIGQLYRHDLIVPKILNWCIVHLLKNHSESEVSQLSLHFLIISLTCFQCQQFSFWIQLKSFSNERNYAS